MKKTALVVAIIFPVLLSAAIIHIATEPELQAAVWSLSSNDTLMLSAGTYDLTWTLWLDGGLENVAIIGAGRDATTIRGPGMSVDDPDVPHLIWVGDVRHLYIADLTLRDVYYHPIQISTGDGAFAPHIANVRIIDSGEQFIKVSTGIGMTAYCDSGIVENCVFEYTDRARWWYTNGVDILATGWWIIRDNLFLRIRGPVGELAGPAVLAWQNAIHTTVERNVFIECDFGISMGNSAGPGPYARDGETVYDNQNAIVFNNFIYRAESGDVGITLNRARDAEVHHNTIILNGTFPWNIEYRYGSTSAMIYNNLCDGAIFSRDGGAGALDGNIISAEESWFVNASEGNLHLISGTDAENAAVPIPGFTVDDDIDGEPRPYGSASDVGADEFMPGAIVRDISAETMETRGHLGFSDGRMFWIGEVMPERLEIFDLTGRRVLSGATANVLESAAKLPTGIYLYRFDSHGKEAGGRIVVVR